MMLVSPEYQAQIQQLHKDDPSWGSTGRHFAPLVLKVVQDYAPLNILDYGCGKQSLSRSLPEFHITGYDPGVPGIDTPPAPVDFVICTDVLEHVESAMLDDVLDDLQRVVKDVLFVAVSTVDAYQILSDGRNAHLVVKPLEWWLPKLMNRFSIINLAVVHEGFHALLKAKKPAGNGNQ